MLLGERRKRERERENITVIDSIMQPEIEEGKTYAYKPKENSEYGVVLKRKKKK